MPGGRGGARRVGQDRNRNLTFTSSSCDSVKIDYTDVVAKAVSVWRQGQRWTDLH